jgi:hypothetical protein
MEVRVLPWWSVLTGKDVERKPVRGDNPHLWVLARFPMVAFSNARTTLGLWNPVPGLIAFRCGPMDLSQLNICERLNDKSIFFFWVNRENGSWMSLDEEVQQRGKQTMGARESMLSVFLNPN